MLSISEGTVSIDANLVAPPNLKAQQKTAPVRTYGGVMVDLCNPYVSSITIETVAHSLSLINRFNGHTSRGLSVAEHSYWASMMAGPEDALQALMHDAAEAFLGDVVSPLKNVIKGYGPLERMMEARLGKHLIGSSLGKKNDRVKQIDARLWATERVVFQKAEETEGEPYRYSFTPKWFDRIRDREGSKQPTIYYHWFMWPGRAKGLFLKRFRQLTGTNR